MALGSAISLYLNRALVEQFFDRRMLGRFGINLTRMPRSKAQHLAARQLDLQRALGRIENVHDPPILTARPG